MEDNFADIAEQMRSIFNQIRARLFRQYEVRISHLENADRAMIQGLVSRTDQLAQSNAEMNQRLEALVELVHRHNHEIKEFQREIKQLRERPDGDWTASGTSSDHGSRLYVERLTSSLRKRQ